MGRIFEVRKATMFKRFDRMAKQFTRIGKEIVHQVVFRPSFRSMIDLNPQE